MAAPERPATIVIADDDDLVRAVLRMALAGPATTIREAADSVALVAALEHGVVDLVILDISIPGPGLGDNVAAIHDTHPGARILVLSGDASFPAEFADSINDFARKPIDLSELRDRVGHLLAATRTTESP
ncbi:MAG TPA: response regulator [Microcella sp.]|nr:response regulator [Microcella sp.]